MLESEFLLSEVNLEHIHLDRMNKERLTSVVENLRAHS